MQQLKTKVYSSLLTSLISLINLSSWAISVSELKSDETLVFFNTSAWFNAETSKWHVPIHGWVYEPENSIVRKSLVSKILSAAFDLKVDENTEENYNRRINLMMADNERNKAIVIKFANITYTLTKSAPNGHFSQTLLIDDEIFKQNKISDQLIYHAVLKTEDPRLFEGRVNLVQPTGISIISDIDDTIKVSEVTNRKQLINHTFYQDFTAVAEMAEHYQSWLGTGGALHFVSSSPWQLYEELVTFINDAGFPEADLHLKSFRFKDKSFFNLFAKSTKTKPAQIEKLITQYPDRTFILVGDSGEHDPEIYAQIQQQFPNQIKQILIRNVSAASLSDDRFIPLLKKTNSNIWQLFKSTSDIEPF